MKRVVKLGARAITVAMWARLMTVITVAVAAIAYCSEAQRDESSGYGFTAAMKWRRAAQLIAFIPFASDLCWQQWERIMRLPRRLAVPIGAVAQQAQPRVLARIHPAPETNGVVAASQVRLASAA
jgi:hypothetical protein